MAVTETVTFYVKVRIKFNDAYGTVSVKNVSTIMNEGLLCLK